MKSEKIYICVGENFGFDIDIGFCGKVKTLKSWLLCLFPNQTEEYIVDYFKHDSNATIIDYIYRNKGKRLKEIKR